MVFTEGSGLSKGVSRINKFVSKKISSVRWRPVSQHVLTLSTEFVSGSWDDEDNVLQLWQWEDPGDDPQCLQRIATGSDVTCITYISTDLLAVATAAGDVTLYRHVGGRLQTGPGWQRLHANSCGGVPCTWVSAFEQELVTVGDDGRIAVLSTNSRQPTRVLEEADTCSIYRVQHISHSNVATSNMRGQIKCWDLRSQQDTPASSVSASQQQLGVTSLARHPSQYHVLASGDIGGVICIWDLRQPRFAVAELKSHSGEVSDLLFHRSGPDSLFSAAQDGSVCQWNIDAAATSNARLQGNNSLLRNKGLHGNSKDTSSGSVASSWLTLDSTRRYLDVLSLLPAGPLPVNCLDVAEDRLVCGGDNHVLHCISSLTL